MKRGKLFLTAFAAVALVGSALAFNASKGTTQIFFPNPSNPSVCDQPSSELYKSHASNQITATTIQGNACATLLSTSVE